MHLPEAGTSSVYQRGEQVVRNFSRLTIRTRILIIAALLLLSTLYVSGTARLHSFGLLLYNAPSRLVAGSGNSEKWAWTRPRPGHLIPPKIWQVMLPKNWSATTPISPDRLQETKTWLALNPDYAYTLVGKNGSEDFIQRHFDTNISSIYNSLPNVGMQSDMLRYLLLDIEGGVYTDTDTIARKPIDVWVPPHLRNQTRVIVGIEFDQLDGPAWVDIPHALQFCQWTIAAAPGHPIFKNMVARIVSWVDDMVQRNGVTRQELNLIKVSSFDVMNSTGPAAWTDVVSTVRTPRAVDDTGPVSAACFSSLSLFRSLYFTTLASRTLEARLPNSCLQQPLRRPLRRPLRPSHLRSSSYPAKPPPLRAAFSRAKNTKEGSQQPSAFEVSQANPPTHTPWSSLRRVASNPNQIRRRSVLPPTRAAHCHVLAIFPFARKAHGSSAVVVLCPTHPPFDPLAQ
ncbi:putative initiation-specific alpha-1,6-mannosyltransferase [Colletotrichum sublineola]|uniref:Putative initiation-specific alpha-1,6-mannosyltransferase n=1 Tax=Colletotrichum sublineola TaxID=1173701 RepID=A0A066XC41_COLSU|nr:putative initiation-specific alpha-1,6-mannosyltransferase [Colletotrichum sublineola]